MWRHSYRCNIDRTVADLLVLVSVEPFSIYKQPRDCLCTSSDRAAVPAALRLPADATAVMYHSILSMQATSKVLFVSFFSFFFPSILLKVYRQCQYYCRWARPASCGGSSTSLLDVPKWLSQCLQRQAYHITQLRRRCRSHSCWNLTQLGTVPRPPSSHAPSSSHPISPSPGTTCHRA